MKHAFLIIAHNEYPVLEALLSMLDDERNDVFLHIDKRATDIHQRISDFKMQRAGFYLLKNPMKVYWGDISQVEVEYLLFETALAQGPYAYYHLLSGVDLPIKSQDYIHDFFDKNAGKEFVGFWNDPSHLRDLDRKVSRYHLFTKWKKEKKHPLHGITSLCRNTVLGIQKLIGYRRKHTLTFKKGFQWLSISQGFCEYLSQQKAVVLSIFNHTLCPDELFVQTILWDSPFRANIYCPDDPEKGSMRKIDWKRGKPYIWQSNDYEELIYANQLFARKFHSKEPELIQKIKEAYFNITINSSIR